ncbi:MAG: hypothetical protein JKY19_13305 [Alcanivoracaceae bacterium]|nr:hypothetical protein [Alcanivoracaceae bacterium]
MTLCPYAAISSCSKCPIKKVCLLKGVIGDYKKPEENSESDKKDSSES